MDTSDDAGGDRAHNGAAPYEGASVLPHSSSEQAVLVVVIVRWQVPVFDSLDSGAGRHRASVLRYAVAARVLQRIEGRFAWR